MDKQQAQQKIKELMTKFAMLSETERNKYNEEQTKSYFIRPLFEALGWNFTDPIEVSPEENVSGKRADYEFKINNIPKMYVEAKAIKVDLDLEQHARQAINYAWNKGVSWAVLTDFESIKVYNAQGQSKFLSDKLVFEIKAEDFKNDFDRLWLLSKESFLENELDKYAEKHGKKIKKQTVNERLFNDLREAREILTESFKNWNKELKANQILLEEGVQRILDRIIFIRVLEDRGIEPPTLKEILHQRETLGSNAQLFPLLIKKFRELDEIYNSNLFAPHACEKWEEYDNSLKKVINLLYGNPAVYEYDFSKIPADILGGVYESYLSYIAQKPVEIDLEGKSGKFFKGDDKKELKQKSRKKRKEQGIYYTPRFIVDYIVENTLGKKLMEVKGMADLKKIKILDPACGSGSFLTKTVKTMYEKYRDFDSRADRQSIKTEILLNNIYGVDLDTQAVELAKLNLLIEALDKKAKLPDLTGNIRIGNSLISGSEIELKKYFGTSWRDKHPFNWQDEFEEVFKNGGFDVIIGNPPYLSIERGLIGEIEFFKEKYQTIEKIYDVFGLFIEKSISLLKDNGLFGFIIPNIILQNDSFRTLRKFILNNTKIISINNYKDGVFDGAVVPTTTLILQKTTSDKKENFVNVVNYSKKDDFKETKIKQEKLLSQQFYRFNITTDENFENIKQKTFNSSIKLNEILKIQEAIKTGDDKKFISENKVGLKNPKVLLKGADIDRYLILKERFINYDEKELKRPGKKEIFELPQKLYIRRIANKIMATLDDNKRYAVHTLYTGVLLNKNYSYKYILGVLNSKLFSYLYVNLYPFKGNVFPEIRIGNLGELPIKQISDKEQRCVEKLVDKILELNKQLQNTPENSDKWNEIKREIEKTDKEIDRKVYSLYGLTEEEIKIIENK
jgi:type I restriction-modification system DNA methylase subunit